MAFSDNFNRANENLEASANWTRVGGTAGTAAVSSNKLNVTDTTSGGTAYQCPDIGTADHYVEASWLDNDRASGPFICCRLTDNNNFIGVRFNGETTATHIEVYTRKAGTLSNLLNANSPINNGDILRLEVEGAAWRVKVNGTLRHNGTFTEGVLAGVTRCGIVSRVVSYTALGFIDDFAAGSLISSISASLSATEANDAVSSASALALKGAASKTEASDTIASTATIALRASLAATEASDSASASATVRIAAAASVVESGDSLSATIAASSRTGAAAITEAGDTLASAGKVALKASASITESGDTLSTVAGVSIKASVSIAEAGDTVSARGVPVLVSSPQERAASVQSEDRTAAVAAEIRSASVKAETRSASVRSETRLAAA